MVREGRIFTSTAGSGRPAFGSGLMVNVLAPGAQVTQGSVSTTITVAAGHGFAAGDKYMVGTDLNTYSGALSIVSVTATTLELSAIRPVASGDLIVNLGPDTGVAEPLYDGNSVTVYVEQDYQNAFVNGLVWADANGRYRYHHKGIARWEIVRNSLTPIAIYVDTASTVASCLESVDPDGVSVYGCSDLPTGLTSLSGARGFYLDKASTTPGAMAINFFRDGQERWSMGEDTIVGDRSFFALWSDKAQVVDGAFAPGDILGVLWAGGDSLGRDPVKWSFNHAFGDQADRDTPYVYRFFCAQTLQTSGAGLFCALFNNESADFDSGGIVVQVGGTTRIGMRINQTNSATRYGAIQLGRAQTVAPFFLGWEIGSDLTRTDANSFGIYDAENGVHRFTLTPVGLGLGTNTPDSALHIYKDTAARVTVNASNPNTGDSSARFYAGDGSTGPAIVMERYGAAWSIDATLRGDGMIYSTGGTAMLHFGTGGLKRMTLLDSAAKLGIGVDPPVVALQVNGSLAIQDTAAAPALITGYASLYVDTDGDLKVKFGDGTVKVIASNP